MVPVYEMHLTPSRPPLREMRAAPRLAPTHSKAHIPGMDAATPFRPVEVHPGSSTERLPALGGRAA